MFAAAALAFAGPALREVSIQTHRALGAIGYAEEHEAPRHFRRVHADLARFGGVSRARAELADYLLGPAHEAKRHGRPSRPRHGSRRRTPSARRCATGSPGTGRRRGAPRIARKPFKEHGWDLEFSRLMGRDGWIGVGWPKQFGGQGRSASEQIALHHRDGECRRARRTRTHRGESIVAQALFAHGTKAQQDEWLPAIRRGERTFGARLQRAGGRLRPRRRCAPARCATATTGWSTARSCGRPAATRPSTCGLRCGPIRRRRSTPASAC